MEKKLKVNRRSRLAVLVIVIVALIGVLVINTDPARAVKTTDTQATVPSQVPSDGAGENVPSFLSSATPSLLKLFSALIVVVAAIYVGIYLLKRLMGKKYTGNRQNNLLEVIETTYIAPKKSVSLLRVADKSVLVGMTENQISVLTELDSEETRKVLATVAPEIEGESFGSLLRHATDKIKEISLKRAGKTALET